MNVPSRSAERSLLDGRFIGVNFSKLTHNNQIFRNDFVCNHYHLRKLSAQTIECKIFTPYDFIQLLFYTYIFFAVYCEATLYSVYILSVYTVHCIEDVILNYSISFNMALN